MAQTLDQYSVAGQLLVLSQAHELASVRHYARAAAEEVAQHGVAAGQGWLRGIWYLGGVRQTMLGDCSYWAVVLALQVPLGVQIVAP